MTAEERIVWLEEQLKQALERVRVLEEQLTAAHKRIEELEKQKTPPPAFAKANMKKPVMATWDTRSKNGMGREQLIRSTRLSRRRSPLPVEEVQR